MHLQLVARQSGSTSSAVNRLVRLRVVSLFTEPSPTQAVRIALAQLRSFKLSGYLLNAFMVFSSIFFYPFHISYLFFFCYQLSHISSSFASTQRDANLLAGDRVPDL